LPHLIDVTKFAFSASENYTENYPSMLWILSRSIGRRWTLSYCSWQFFPAGGQNNVDAWQPHALRSNAEARPYLPSGTF
jgi:hypothetical protein